jgi:hypothetical protein
MGPAGKQLIYFQGGHKADAKQKQEEKKHMGGVT